MSFLVKAWRWRYPLTPQDVEGAQSPSFGRASRFRAVGEKYTRNEYERIVCEQATGLRYPGAPVLRTELLYEKDFFVAAGGCRFQ